MIRLPAAVVARGDLGEILGAAVDAVRAQLVADGVRIERRNLPTVDSHARAVARTIDQVDLRVAIHAAHGSREIVIDEIVSGVRAVAEGNRGAPTHRQLWPRRPSRLGGA